MPAPLPTREELSAAARALRADWEAGEGSDAALRAQVLERLDALRDLYRTAPELFTREITDELRAVGEGLRRPLGAPRAAHRAAPAVEPRSAAAVDAGSTPGVDSRATPGAEPRCTPSAARRVEPGEGAERAARLLRELFGHERFRPGQREIIEAVLAGRDCVGVMPTGAGKSLTYQIPARLLGGVTLVISPLIALMKDQVDAMSRVGLSATFLNSSLSPEERRERIEGLRAGRYELLYAAPEGLEASVGGVLQGLPLSLIAVDEAHCISHWGHDFRPAYRNLSGLKARFGNLPVLALTATATREVTRDIASQLGMERPLAFRGTFFRPNLRLHAYKKGEEREGSGKISVRDSILRLVRARPGKSGIVYCLSRKSSEGTAEFLRDHGVRAAAYHAGLEAEERARVQDAFQADEVDVVVATVAFGMGIDKPDTRYVIHRDMPRSIEGYYQEIGRAGRDGRESDCVLFYSWADVLSYDRFAGEAEDPEIQRWQKRQVRQMFDFADGARCRHQDLAAYFGEELDPCGASCDHCAGLDLVASAPAAGRRKVRLTPRAAPGTRGRDDDAGPETAEGDLRLFEALRALRTGLARARKVPPYVIFPDSALALMAERKPVTEDQLLEVPGVGEKKLALYGEEFLAVLRKHA
ncbi:RecQ family ATP-dependent DNA helicase [Anaeromyxobacter paludicola]|uniref:ATP-dependent DNA helicase RecQ n=1 Tax=Anaeromyxobacter paludicola TaxID=2918171 RepID=A0ABM7XFI3_9BACT|nr:ATP-dependent DNA helicase RecQ [Anaeromyxobacter paludicola]BDG10636.1 hypothetical protein AMPC_37490 [Anaeromyxobacter paludicola]